MEVRNVRLGDLDFDRKQLRVVQGKGKKNRYVLTIGTFNPRTQNHLGSGKTYRLDF